MKSTDTKQLFEDLNAGVFGEQVGRAFSDVAAGVTETGKAGEVVIKFKMKRIGESQQVNISHSLKYIAPTRRGRKIEELSTDTPMHVNPDGEVTLFPKDQGQLFPKDQHSQKHHA